MMLKCATGNLGCLTRNLTPMSGPDAGRPANGR